MAKATTLNSRENCPCNDGGGQPVRRWRRQKERRTTSEKGASTIALAVNETAIDSVELL
jgi:hypothetical protein